MSVATLLEPSGSVDPAPASIRAVLVRSPSAAGDTVPLSVNVTVPPTGRSSSVSIAPEPLPAAQVAPPAVAQVQVTPVIVAGGVSVTRAPSIVDGPALVATIV